MNRFRWIIFLITICFANTAFSGGMHSGGTDLYPIDDGAAWFIGKGKTVSYCYELDSRFGVSRTFAETNIRKALDLWVAYIGQAFIQNEVFNDLAVQFQQISSCQNADLRIYLGSEPPEVLKQKEVFNNPMAFVYRENYDASLGWGKGFMWLASQGQLDSYHPNWRKEKVLLSVLMHEFGHILGVGHIPETIMDENLLVHLQGNILEKNGFLGKLNWTKTIVSCWRDCSFEYQGEITSNIFSMLFHRPAVGQVKAKFSPQNGLTISDSTEEKLFSLSLESLPFVESNSVEVFKQVRSEKIDNQEQPVFRIQSLRHQGQSLKGKLKIDKSQVLNVLISLNLISNSYVEGVDFKGPIKIEFVDKNEMKPFFVSKSNNLRGNK